jgi:putative NADPH-quinone reductase
MKNILLINGHHKKESFSTALVNAYIIGAKKSNAKLKLINMYDTNFQFIESGFDNSKENKNAQELMKWANHIVWVYPIWWYGIPSKLKSFIENVIVSGFAYKYHEKGASKFVKWDKYFGDKSTRIIATMDAPPWFFKLIFRDPNFKTMKQVFKFCGIKSNKRTYFGSVKMSTEEQRKKWLLKVEQIGKQLK